MAVFIMSSEPPTAKEVRFFLQDVEHVVDAGAITPKTTLNSYIRNVLHLKGTKYMCKEGGCGACVVVVKGQDALTKKEVTLAVNSCLVSILSCHGWRIYTIEGIGGPLSKYHPIQETLAKFNGTQCGFCSSGMVMNMYALYESRGGDLSMGDVENSFGGNICRCTGYRPILAGFKSLCKDADATLLGACSDIEDVVRPPAKCFKPCAVASAPFIHISGDSQWTKVFTIDDLLATMKKYKNYYLVCGHTAKGVFSQYRETYEGYIDISAVTELRSYTIKDKLVLGANISLTNAIEVLNATAATNGYAYLKKLATHIDLIANVPVRNIGSLAGNLMMKHDHNDFPSDIFLILETVGAQLTIVNTAGKKVTMSPLDFIKTSMNYKVLTSISLPSLSDDFKFESFKIMLRAQNAHAIVNAGFLFQLTNSVVKSARIVYGNISNTFTHAKNTENYLIGKDLFSNVTLSGAYAALEAEINPVENPPDPSPAMRKGLAISLFYKAVLGFAPAEKVSARNRSGGSKLERPLSSGVQDFETNKSLYPVTKAMPKLEALAQTSGQAEYVFDMPILPDQHYAAFVLANSPAGSQITKIDATKALAVEGMVAFYTKSDIPGDNNFTPKGLFTCVEEILCSGTVAYYHQPAGLLVGKDEEAVTNAISLVTVTCKPPITPPLIGIREILKAGRMDKIHEERTIKPERKGDNIKHVVKGTFDIHEQYHFHMETQACNVIPNEDGLDVYPSSQWMDLTQMAIANMLKLPNNKINVNVRRCGGAFGAKISRNTLITCAAALAAWKLRKPVKMVLSLTENMEVIGKRWPLSHDYEVAVNEEGVIQYLESTMYTDQGSCNNETGINELLNLFTANYVTDTFSVHMKSARSDTYANTWARGPGTTEGLAAIEALMEHLAYEIKMDPVALRRVNIDHNKELLKYLDDLYSWADIAERKQDIIKFNSANRWMKKGIAVVPMAYELCVAGPYPVMVSIYHGDGSVAISHGGVEVGQGINTKAAQTCAYKLGIPMEKVAVIPSKNFISPNAATTGGSVTSEAICYGVERACDILRERFEPYRDDQQTWNELIQKCFDEFVNLSAIAQYSPKSPGVEDYLIYGSCAAEVLLDVLTGQHLITRIDLIEDTGRSINPDIDIGQVEGAFIMGIGYYTMERIIYNSDGKVLTNNTWTYKPPTAKDIPIDFRVKFPKNNENPVGVLKSKATAEPPLCMSVCVPLAVRNAVASARTDSNSSQPKWYPFDGPSTVENTFLNTLNNSAQYTL